MTGSAVPLAWAIAAAALAMAALAWRQLRRGRELVARACHELRGPLTAAHLALHAGARPGDPSAGARLAAIDLELRRAGRALDDLAAARAGRRAGDCDEVVDVCELIADQAAAWRAIAPLFGCVLRVGPPIPDALVRGDRVRLAQAVGNLLANALEHGTGTVEVAVRSIAGRVRIEVTDEGGGLPAPVAELARARDRLGHRRAPRRTDRLGAERARRAAGDRAAGRSGGGNRARIRPGRGGMTRRRRAAVLIGLSLILGALAASDVSGREAALRREVGPAVPVLVARSGIPARARLRAEALAVRRVPARYAPAGAYRSPADVAGLRAAVAIPAGADVDPSVVDDGTTAAGPSGPALRTGERVAQIVAIGPAQTLAPGARVDVLVTRDGAGDAPGSTTLALEDVEVLSAGRAPEAGGSGPDAGLPRVALDLRVTVRQAVYLAAAQSFARELRVLPRAPGDRRRGAQGLRVGGRL